MCAPHITAIKAAEVQTGLQPTGRPTFTTTPTHQGSLRTMGLSVDQMPGPGEVQQSLRLDECVGTARKTVALILRSDLTKELS